MPTPSFTCPRCLHSCERDGNLRFCPKCGLLDEAPADRDDPIEVKIGALSVKVGARLAFGDVANVYRCTAPGVPGVAVFKVTRTHYANPHLVREADTLRRILEQDSGRFAPFLPNPLATTELMQSNGEPGRRAVLLRYFDGIDGPDELYSLKEVREAYPNGIDARDMAWIWRRLLSLLGFVHQCGYAHGLATPDHVLIEPKSHKLVLIGWSGAVALGCPPLMVPLRWKEWIDPAKPASGATDLACAGRSMAYLLDSSTDPAITRHLQRAGATSDAWRLLEDFDRLIQVLWGPRQFRAFAMPGRRLS